MKRQDASGIGGYAAFIPALALTGCGSAPSLEILGSFFPSWMLCAALGIAGAVVLRLIFAKLDIEASIPFRPLVYPLLAGALAFILWLIRFGN